MKIKYKTNVLNEIKRLIYIYNSFDEDDQLELQKKSNKLNVENIYVCWYDDNGVGLYEKFDWVTSRGDFGYDAGSVYTEFNGNNVGIKMCHDGHYGCNQWLKKDDIRYVYSKKTFYQATCDMYKTMSIDDIRKKMKENNVLSDYTEGVATVQELQAALDYAKENMPTKASLQRTRK